MPKNYSPLRRFFSVVLSEFSILIKSIFGNSSKDEGHTVLTMALAVQMNRDIGCKLADDLPIRYLADAINSTSSQLGQYCYTRLNPRQRAKLVAMFNALNRSYPWNEVTNLGGLRSMEDITVLRSHGLTEYALKWLQIMLKK